MVTSEEVLDAVQGLTLATGRLPSILEIAKAVGLTKQGVLHHFPTRAALDAAVTRRALSRVDAAMTKAAADGSPLETYLRLSSPTGGDQVVVLVLMAALRRPDSVAIVRASLRPLVEIERTVSGWQAMIADEVGDPTQAEVVRLVGDGLFSEALLTGTPPSSDRLTRLVAHLRGAPMERHK